MEQVTDKIPASEQSFSAITDLIQLIATTNLLNTEEVDYRITSAEERPCFYRSELH